MVFYISRTLLRGALHCAVRGGMCHTLMLFFSMFCVVTGSRPLRWDLFSLSTPRRVPLLSPHANLITYTKARCQTVTTG